jgi:hypothetical protein
MYCNIGQGDTYNIHTSLLCVSHTYIFIVRVTYNSSLNVNIKWCLTTQFCFINRSYGFRARKDLYIILSSNLLSSSVHDEGYCRHTSLSVHDEGYCRHTSLSVHDEGYCRHTSLSVHDEGYCRHTSCAMLN